MFLINSSSILFASLLLISAIIKHKKNLPILFITSILYAYIILGPSISGFSYQDIDLEVLYQYQTIFIILFLIPVLLFANFIVREFDLANDEILRGKFNISIFLPIFLLSILTIFLYTIFEYGLFFRRMGHEGLYQTSSEIPSYLKYIYRGASEASFFIIMTLRFYAIHELNISSKRFVQLTILLYGLVFGAYFLLNSRMQFLFIIFSIFVPLGKKYDIRPNQLKYIILISLLIIGMTLFRELFLESFNQRVNGDDFFNTLKQSLILIFERLNIFEIFVLTQNYNMSPFSINLTGILNTFQLPIAYFFDKTYYLNALATLQTSSSVAIINDITGKSFIDFPKSQVTDFYFSFGILSIPIFTIFYCFLIKLISDALAQPRLNFKTLFIFYLLTFIFQFEKEFLTILISPLKWAPLFLLLFLFRPKKLI